MYNSIYDNSEYFKKYLDTISYTKASKRKILDTVIDKITLPVNKKVCLLPCDVGMYYQILKELEPANEFILIDKSQIPLKYISNKNTHTQTKYIKADISEKFEFQLNFDIAFTFLALQHIKDIEQFFNNVIYSLNKNGVFVIVTFSDSDINNNIMSEFFGNNEHSFHTSRDIENNLYKSGFQNIETAEISFDIEIKENEIPFIFNKFSNSFLYKQTQEKIGDFYQFLKDKVIEGFLKVNHNYTLIIAKTYSNEYN